MLLVVCLVLLGGWIGWTVNGMVVNRQLHQYVVVLEVQQRLLERTQKTTVDQAIKTLEISLKSGNRDFILGSWELAIEASQIADGYGAERLKELESQGNLQPIK